jgi:tRNA isopentenyl-2-thiomethyl-A-37 hydroxylase MiaE
LRGTARAGGRGVKALPERLRRLVLLALTPAPLPACSDQLGVIEDGRADLSNDASAAGGDDSATAPGAPNEPRFPGDACVVVPADSGCDPRWIDGDGSAPPIPVGGGMAYRGSALWPCGPASSALGGPSSFVCDPLCPGGSNSCTEYNLCGNPIGSAQSYWGSSVDLADSGTNPVVFSCYDVRTGRRPTGLIESLSGVPRSIGDALARAAYLESASIVAFIELANLLAAHRAPRRLIRRLRRAAADEVRHARQMSLLARARGVEPAAVCVEPVRGRSLLDIALENAREGCVRETWGAAFAVAQAQRAADPQIRDAMVAIARDELRHAALSWDLEQWLLPRLAAEGRALVAAERCRAIAALEADLAQEVPRKMRVLMGLPSAQTARALFSSMRSTVWRQTDDGSGSGWSGPNDTGTPLQACSGT